MLRFPAEITALPARGVPNALAVAGAAAEVGTSAVTRSRAEPSDAGRAVLFRGAVRPSPHGATSTVSGSVSICRGARRSSRLPIEPIEEIGEQRLIDGGGLPQRRSPLPAPQAPGARLEVQCWIGSCAAKEGMSRFYAIAVVSVMPTTHTRTVGASRRRQSGWA